MKILKIIQVNNVKVLGKCPKTNFMREYYLD